MLGVDKIFVNKIEMICCTSGHHHLSESRYKTDSVPISMFLRYPEKEKSEEIFKTCVDCRNYDRERKKNRNIIKELEKKEFENNDFKICGNRDHNKKCVGSLYPYGEVPIEKFFKVPGKPESGSYKNCIDCRIYGRRNNKSIVKETKYIFEELNPDIKYRECSSTGHHKKSRNSKYPKEKVPSDMFLKDSNNPNDLYDTCLDCRNYTKNNRNKKIKIREEFLKDESTKFISCLNISHKSSGSEYSPEKVPIEKFIDEENPDGPLKKDCIDCANYLSNVTKERKRLNRLEAEAEGNFACNCGKIVGKEDMGINIDGSLSKSCKTCQIKTYANLEKQKIFFIELKKSFIKEHECSCQKCKSIFLIPEEENSLIPRELSTFVKEDVRYVTYENREYVASEFLKEYEKLLELRIIEFDHLSEEVQRKRGILKENEKYKKKKKTVRNMLSIQGKLNESKKCQHLCARCHLEETVLREGEILLKIGIWKEKADYIKNIKKCGCSHCGYSNINILRFFEMDHLDPKNKLASICEMVRKYNYSLQDVIKECEKCRILCRHCHLIHSFNQRKQGLFIKYKYEEEEYRDDEISSDEE
jgi:hypothetical protein